MLSIISPYALMYFICMPLIYFIFSFKKIVKKQSERYTHLSESQKQSELITVVTVLAGILLIRFLK